VRWYLVGEPLQARLLWFLGLIGNVVFWISLFLLPSYGEWQIVKILYFAGATSLIAYFAFYYKAPNSEEQMAALSYLHEKWLGYSKIIAAVFGLALMFTLLTSIFNALDMQPKQMPNFGLQFALLYGALLTLIGPLTLPVPVPLQFLWQRRYLPTLLTYLVWVTSIVSWYLLFRMNGSFKGNWSIDTSDSLLLALAYLHLAFSLICTQLARLTTPRRPTPSLA